MLGERKGADPVPVRKEHVPQDEILHTYNRLSDHLAGDTRAKMVTVQYGGTHTLITAQ